MVNAKTKKVMKQFIPKRANLAQIKGADPFELPNLNKGKAPESDRDLANKAYCDNLTPSIKLNEVQNPDASKTFNLGNNKFLTFTSVDRTPIAGEGIFNFECSGNFTGDLVHIHQHTGNAGANTVLLKLEAEDDDVCLLNMVGQGTSPLTLLENTGNNCKMVLHKSNVTTGALGFNVGANQFITFTTGDELRFNHTTYADLLAGTFSATTVATLTDAGLFDAVGGFSDNGSAGIDTTISIVGAKSTHTITVKGGIITAYTIK